GHTFFTQLPHSTLDASRTHNENRYVIQTLGHRIWRLLTTPYSPDPTVSTYISRAQTQENESAQVTVAVLDAREAARMFGVPLTRRGTQPVYLKITNRTDHLMRLQLVRI